MKLQKTEVWSCGGGTQSGAIAVLIGMGKLSKPDLCFMTNTGREKSGTWPFVEAFIRPHLAKAGAELQIIKAADGNCGRLASQPVSGLQQSRILLGLTHHDHLTSAVHAGRKYERR